MAQRGPLPSVTEILDAVGLGMDLRVSAARREYLFARGRALHYAIQLDQAGELDAATVHPEIAGKLDAWRKWAAAVQWQPQHVEVELVHPTWAVVGHPDAIGLANGRLTLTDWKSSFDLHSVRLQLSAYAWLWQATHSDEPIDDYLALELQAVGRYVPHPIDPRPYQQVFLAAVIVHRARLDRER